MIGAGDLVAVSGATMRQVQFWTDLGLLKATPSTHLGGRGIHGLYEQEETHWSLLAVELSKLCLPVKTIKVFLDLMRDEDALIVSALRRELVYALFYPGEGRREWVMDIGDDDSAMALVQSGIFINVTEILDGPRQRRAKTHRNQVFA